MQTHCYTISGEHTRVQLAVICASGGPISLSAMPATQPAAASAVALAAATDEAASGARHRALQEEAAPGAADALLQALQEPNQQIIFLHFYHQIL